MTDKLKVNTKTKISNFVDAQRAIQELQKNFNSLVEKALSPAEKKLGETEGSTGDIQITQNKDKTYTFEVRTEDGWKTPVIGDSLIKFKGKPKSISQDKKEAIEDIEANDTTTGDSKANKTIYDEKNDKFVLPRPDYESDWVDVTVNSNYTYTHNLGTKVFKLIQLIFKDDSDRIFYPGVGFHEDGSSDKGIYAWAQTDDVMQISTGEVTVFAYQNFPDIGSEFDVNDGYIKIMLWK
jgi:hypothetical protein